ncbi:M48 family metallopeptidase [Polynucleobacter brandtiae]|uniref:Peptidase M48-like protein n=1 Tax=Polynucleobacter brandtiae TaxID=1938816 RepID=A0A2M8VY49_9BURK|nr:peptidase M48-like protein [Polynucleobacter brandtiae]
MQWLRLLLHQKRSNLLQGQWSKLDMRFCLGLACTLLLAACANTTRPGAVGITRSQFMMASSDDVNRLSASSYNEQNQKAKDKNILVNSGPTYDRLKAIANRLIPQTEAFRDDTKQWDWRLTLIDAPALNATCAPGGKITFYTGIIEQLNLNDDEIAAIMGHEIAHAVREHGRERVSQAAAQSILVNIAMAVAGPYGSAISVANQAAQYAIVLPNSRENETEADAIGLELAARAGYNPAGAISVWKKMLKATKDQSSPEFLSTHPSGETRIDQLTALMPTVEPLYKVALKPKAYEK